MSAPAWFDKNVYFQNKLAQLKVVEPTANWTETSLVKAFDAAGYDASNADSLFSHFEQYGNTEGVSPSGYFVSSAYLQNKLTQMQADDPTYTMAQLEAALKDAGLSAWDHYTQYGAAEGLSTSQYFNTNDYLNAKLAQMQATDPAYTMDQLKADLQAAGLNPIEHYMLYGKDESLSYTPSTYPAAPEPPVLPDPGNPGETFYLTEGRDVLTGTAADDEFIAEIGDLNAADRIDGGEGNDTLHAYLAEEFITGGDVNSYAINPTIKNVETLLFTAQGTSVNGGGDNLTQAAIDFDRVKLDDGKVMTIGSFNSRADLSIEDVRHKSNETVIRFQDADPNVDFNVYFDSKHIVAEDAKTSGNLELQLIDAVGAYDDPEYGALRDNPYTGFNFTLNGVEYRINFGAYNSTTDETPTYAELAEKIQEAINNDATLNGLGLTVNLGSSFEARVGIGDHKGEVVNGTRIVLSTEQGKLVEGNWIAANGLPPTNSTSATMQSEASTDCPLTTTTLELSGAGRVDFVDNLKCLPNLIKGSSAGDVLIGSMANANGVERIELKVDEGSWISSLSSTNDALRMVKVGGQDIDGDGVIENGDLYIGDWNGFGDMKGDGTKFTWTDKAALLTAAKADDGSTVSGLVDVAVFDADGYTGNINVAAAITSDSYDKYLKGVDGNEDGLGNPPFPKYDNAFTYNTGTGNDVVNMTVNGAIAADSDFKMNINTGAGDDVVAFHYDSMTANQSANQKKLQNVTIDTGAGDDTVWFYAPAATDPAKGGSVVIRTGAGNDVIYANQQDFFSAGNPTNVSNYNAVWVFNTTTTGITVDGVKGATLGNDLEGNIPEFTATGMAAGSNVAVKVDFLGFTAYMTVKGDTNQDGSFTMSAKQVNQAIMQAIESDATLSALISAKDGAGHSLIVESLINGNMTDTPVSISFGTVTNNTYTDGGVTVTNSGQYMDAAKFATDANGAEFTGVNTTNSQVVVNAGAGDDVIVLGPNTLQGSTTDYRDVVELDTNFGNDSLVGFKSGEDKINLFNLLNNPTKITDINTLTSLANNGAIVYDFNAPIEGDDNADGIYTQANIDALIANNQLELKFTSPASGDKAVVFLHNTNADGQNVYTVLQVTPNGNGVSATVAGSLTLEEGKAIANSDLTYSNAFDAKNNGGGGEEPGKGGKPHEATAGETIDAGGDKNLDIQINSAAFNNAASTEETALTITGFGKDDKLTLDSKLSDFTFLKMVEGTTNTGRFTVLDAEGDTFYINIQSDLFTPETLTKVSLNGIEELNTIFDAGTVNTTLVGA